ncbi:Spo0B domain-containing protein [Virgibacillus flavescens]|uniref:Spo0B domain-containing protein n=1 Tax=Virgibacillus flavescens TaxID=1611422 RepID=UPI003D34FD44
MEQKEVMNLLRYYRHDIMNDLQIVHAYTSMGKLEKVKEKLATYMEHFDEERKLMNLNAPALTLWLIPFNSIHPNYRFTYAIRNEHIDISEIDEKITEHCRWCVNHFQKYTSEEELYEGDFVLTYLPEKHEIQVVLTLYGAFSDKINKKAVIENRNITQEISDYQISLSIIIPWNRKGEK